MATSKTQSEAILDHLRRGGRLTPLEALERFGCSRLAARVWELKERGWAIGSRVVVVGSGKRVKEYFLPG